MPVLIASVPVSRCERERESDSGVTVVVCNNMVWDCHRSLVLRDSKLFGTVPAAISALSAIVYATNAYVCSNLKIAVLGPVCTDPLNVLMLALHWHGVYAGRTMDISGNLFSGGFPDSVEALHSLQTLNLSYNHFYKSIPETLYLVTSLTYAFPTARVWLQDAVAACCTRATSFYWLCLCVCARFTSRMAQESGPEP